MNPEIQPGQRLAVICGPLILDITEIKDDGSITGTDPHGDTYTIDRGVRYSHYTRIQVIDQAEPGWPADAIPDAPDASNVAASATGGEA